MRINVQVMDANDLSKEHRERWLELVATNPVLDGPCFQPDFICGLARYLDGCKVAIIGRPDEPVGYWPFCLAGEERVARQIPMCDYQGIVSHPSSKWNVREILRAAGLKAWQYKNLIREQAPVRKSYNVVLARSHRVALDGGFAQYLESKGNAAKTLRHKLHLLQRDHGEVTFVQDVQDEAALDQLVSWKAERYAQGEPYPPCIAEALKHFLRLRGKPVRGVLSLLKAGDRVVASRFGLKVGGLFHGWWTAFDSTLAKYSPGWLIHWHVLKGLHEIGCTILDFGPGHEAYKEDFGNSFVNVASGIVESSAAQASLRRGLTSLRKIARNLPGVKRLVLIVRQGYRSRK